MSSPRAQEKNLQKQKPKIPFYQDVDGFRIPGMFAADAYRSAIAYKPQPGDLFIVTYPKCGTTWVQNLVASIFRKGKPFENFFEFMVSTPFLEMAGAEAVQFMKRPGAIKVHLPFRLTPWSPEAKYIFVARNPKDCCVSFYHHTENFPEYKFVGGEFDDFFELFIEGETDFGDYFDTLVSWYEHRNDPNVFFITYEQLKKDTEGTVLKMAEFMGPQYKDTLLNDDKVLKNVIHNNSFKVMKESFNKGLTDMFFVPKEEAVNNPNFTPAIKKLFEDMQKMEEEVGSMQSNFVRKGIVGDWRNYFSPMQNARMEKKFRERTTGTDIRDLWKDDM